MKRSRITKKMFRAIQFGANIGIIVMTLLLIFIVAQNYIFSSGKTSYAQLGSSAQRKNDHANTDRPVGSTLDLKDVNWNDSSQTMVLYLSTTCGYCAQSLPFYRRMLQARTNRIKVIAVFTDEDKNVDEYLRSHDIVVDKVISDSLERVGVVGTPTILVVNSSGIISKFWRGKLSAGDETEVLSLVSS